MKSGISGSTHPCRSKGDQVLRFAPLTSGDASAWVLCCTSSGHSAP